MRTPTLGRQKPIHVVKMKPGRNDLRAGECLCAHCPAKCCRYFALPIETPTDWEDFEYIRWFLFHERAAVFTEKGDWYLLVYTRCKHLRDDNLCAIYDDRPKICRDYSTVDCEYDDDWVYDQYFETSEQVVEYAEAVLGPRGKKREKGEGRRERAVESAAANAASPLPLDGRGAGGEGGLQ